MDRDSGSPHDARRTRKLIKGDEPMLRSKNKEAVTALREIADGLVLTDRSTIPAGTELLGESSSEPAAAEAAAPEPTTESPDSTEEAAAPATEETPEPQS